jgi:hypothetical protein
MNGKKANLFGPADDEALEARDRLRQLVHIVTRLEDLQTFRDSHPNDQDRDKWTEMEVYTEAFYWIIFRLRQVVKNLPELGSFKFTGVRNVRNHLIEHPEGGDSGITFGNIGIRSDVGPVVRVVRRTGQLDRWMDAGLKPNALEYAEGLELLLRKYLKRIDSPAT